MCSTSMGRTTQQEEHILTIRTGQRNGKAFMEKTPSQSRNHSMSVCRSTSKRQTILLSYGPNDMMVNPKAKYPLLDKLDEYKISHAFVEFPNSGHGLTGDPDKTKEYYQLMDEYLVEYFANN
jgi:predicted esterase